MLLKKWEKLPPEMQTDEVLRYYKILKKKQALERQRLIKQNNTLVKNLNNVMVAQENVNVKPIPYEDIIEFEDDDADLEEYEE